MRDIVPQFLRRIWPKSIGPDMEMLGRSETLSDEVIEGEVDVEVEKPQDYGETANALWTLYGKEAENHDKALIETWRSDMEAIIIFAGLYSATLTSFLVDSYKNLQPDPAQETAFYGRQSASSLAQISQQLASTGSLSPIAPATFVTIRDFTPSSSDVRVNVYWFMSLVFSLSAALFATIIQQWVRYYMQLFQRYDHALKRARLRQYLFQGARRSRMSIMVEVVPALIHISLFLFFMGLADFLFNLNTTTATATVIPIAFCATFYLWAVIGPVIRPQSSYQTPFSGLFWYMFQRTRGRIRHDHGSPKPVSTNMAEGRMQLAMDQTNERQVRDAQAIAWLINNRTEESEIEELMLSIPTSFDTPWGMAAWRTVAQIDASDEDQVLPLSIYANDRWPDLFTHPLPEIHEHSAVRELCKNVGRSLETCRNLVSSGEKLKCARACVGSIASLAICTGASVDNFGDPFFIAEMLIGVGTASEQARGMLPSVMMGPTITFEMHLTCATLLTCRSVAKSPYWIPVPAEVALKHCRSVDRLLHSALQYVKRLCNALEGGLSNDDEEQVRIALREIRKLDDIGAKYHRSKEDVLWRFETPRSTSDLCSLLPGASLDTSTRHSPLIQALATSFQDRRTILQQLVSAEPILQTLVAFGSRLRATIEDTHGTSRERVIVSANELQAIWGELRVNEPPVKVIWERMEERRYWRIEDCGTNGRFGFTVELFFITLQRLLPEDHNTLPATHRVFYIHTFRALTSDWERRCRRSDATQRVLLDLLCDTLFPGRGIVSHELPDWAMDELLDLLKKVFQGVRGSHIDDVVQQLKAVGIDKRSWLGYRRGQALELLRG